MLGESGLRRGGLAALILLLVSLCSCGTPTVINRIKLIQAAGYDLKGQEIHVSALVGDYKEKEKTTVQLMEDGSSNSFDMIPVLNGESNDPIQYGQMRMMVFGQNYAKRGIGPVLNILARDVKISSRLKLAVSDSTAVELLKACETTQEPLYLMRMIEQNSRYANLPVQNLHTTLYNYYDEGRDLFLPSFKLDAEQRLRVDGLALFDGERWISKVGTDQALWLKILIEDAKNGSFVIPMPHSSVRVDKVALIRFASSKTAFKASSVNKPLGLKVNVKGQVIVKNIPGDLKLVNKGEIEKLEREMEQYVADRIDRFIRYCCSKHIDPAGIGDYFRSVDRKWNPKEFYAAYPSLTPKVTVHLKIIQCGRQD
ncbi:Ger(x)C family spore germination protein [Paenibacillus physcomitrellae]|uniref:Germination protein GerC n=1 Tax=Paenibacillus physcomitrellae TaxID=1619311 RepID=A0ABQ1FRT6_9BACL|nr:Ger(x)C family spore germination protein [Paenibacillus physcomitrellae]GGA25517.1 germination protein GerC [Paenibacillus physcomitrellae]